MAEHALADQDHALEHPVERAAVHHLGRPLRRLAGVDDRPVAGRLAARRASRAGPPASSAPTQSLIRCSVIAGACGLEADQQRALGHLVADRAAHLGHRAVERRGRARAPSSWLPASPGSGRVATVSPAFTATEAIRPGIGASTWPSPPARRRRRPSAAARTRRPRRLRTAPPGRRAPRTGRLERRARCGASNVRSSACTSEARPGARTCGSRPARRRSTASPSPARRARSPPRSAGRLGRLGRGGQRLQPRVDEAGVDLGRRRSPGSLSSRARKPALVFTGQTSTAPQAIGELRRPRPPGSAHGRSAWRSSDRRTG